MEIKEAVPLSVSRKNSGAIMWMVDAPHAGLPLSTLLRNSYAELTVVKNTS